jgi:hypothetical protein
MYLGRLHGYYLAENMGLFKRATDWRIRTARGKATVSAHLESKCKEPPQKSPRCSPGTFFVCEVCAGKILEARVGIEPTHKGFADLSLTTWVPRLGWGLSASALLNCGRSLPQTGVIWSGRPGSNRRHLPWQGSTLPLSYSRSYRVKYSGPVRYGQRRLACYCTAIIV